MFQSFWWFHFPFLVVSILQENLISWIGDGFFNRATFKEGMNIFLNDWLSYAEMSKPAKFHGVYDPSPSQTKVSMVGIFGWLKSQHLSCFFPLFFSPENRMSSPCSSLRPDAVRSIGAGRTITVQRLEALWRTATWPVWRHRRRRRDGMGWEDITIRTRMNKPPGKRLHTYGKIHHFLSVNQLFRLGHVQ